MPSQELKRLAGRRAGSIVEVNTTSASKEDGFGRLKVLLSQGRLALPRHPRLLAQLSALEFEERDSGTVRIEVPERSGHDDLCMALMLAAGVGNVASSQGTLRVENPRDYVSPGTEGPRRSMSVVFGQKKKPKPVNPGPPKSPDRPFTFAEARKHPRYKGPGRP
jgi:hypothetical protein